MRYLLEDRGDYFGILNEASDTYVAYVYPQKADIPPRPYRVVNREGVDIAVVKTIDEALPAFAAHISAHPPRWERRSSKEYEKNTYYGDILGVRQNWTGGWAVYRDDRELCDRDGPVISPTLYEAQRLADLHMCDGYVDLAYSPDGPSWLGPRARQRYRLGDELGETVAAAVCAIVCALVDHKVGVGQTEAYDTATELLARLHGMLNVSRVGSFDTQLAGREPYFLRSGSSGGDASSRISFDEAVLHYGKMALRKRLGADTSEAVLCELTSWPLQSLDYTCDHLSKAA